MVEVPRHLFRLPLFVALAPSATVIARTTQTAAAVFRARGLNEEFIGQELTEMGTRQLTTTVNRSVLGSMNDFAISRPPTAHRRARSTSGNLASPGPDTLRTLYRSHISPDREISAYVAEHIH